ncbi:MAG: hypothetical protein IJE59_04430 [Clostridia bacterium]|nr:hypothetical protein [Clostridia bacterium]
MSQNNKESKLEKLLKYEKWCQKGFEYSSVIVIGILIGCFILEAVMNIEIAKSVPIIAIIVTIAIILIWFKISDLVFKEKINQLNNVDFKVIKLRKTDNVLFNQMLKNSKIEAKMHERNDNLIIVKISSSDEKQPDDFNKEYIYVCTIGDIKKIVEDIEI